MKDKKYKESELEKLEKLPEEFLIFKHKKTNKKALMGLKINYSVQQIKKEELKTGGFSSKEDWVGSYSKVSRKQYYQPEQAIMGLILDCLEKTIHPKLILHRLKKQIDKFVKENSLKDKK